MHIHLASIFRLMPRIAFASLLAYLISQYHDVWSFNFWREKTGGKYLWLRNNASTLISQAIDSVIFTGVAFFGTIPFGELMQIFITTYMLKLVVAVVDTPFLYAGRLIAIRMGEYFPEKE